MKVSDNDQVVGRYLMELYLRGTGGCDGFQVTYDQALCMIAQLVQAPKVPLLAVRFVLGQLDQVISPKLDGSPGYVLWIGWDNDKKFFLTVADYKLNREELNRLESLGRLARAQIAWPEEDSLQFFWS